MKREEGCCVNFLMVRRDTGQGLTLPWDVYITSTLSVVQSLFYDLLVSLCGKCHLLNWKQTDHCKEMKGRRSGDGLLESRLRRRRGGPLASPGGGQPRRGGGSAVRGGRPVGGGSGITLSHDNIT